MTEEDATDLYYYLKVDQRRNRLAYLGLKMKIDDTFLNLKRYGSCKILCAREKEFAKLIYNCTSLVHALYMTLTPFF